MISEKKLYLIETLLKLIKHEEVTKAVLSHQYEVFKNIYNFVPKEKFAEIKSKYSQNDFHLALYPAIDNYFSDQELQEIVDFCSSPLGKKMYSIDFNSSLKNASAKFIANMENELSLINNIQQKEKEKNE